MGRFAALVVAAVLATAATGGARETLAQETLAIVGATIVDVGRGEARPDQTVLIEAGRIARVGAGDIVDVPEGVRVLEAGGKWLIPGLIDAHVHFFQSGGLFTRPDVIDLRHIRPYAEEIRRIRADIETTLARYVAAGVTGVVDMGGPFWTFDVRERAAELVKAPRVAVAGPLLGSVAPRELRGLDDPPIVHIATPEEARDVAQKVLAREPDLLKLWLVPAGALAQEMDWVGAAVASARDAGVAVAVHATERAIAKAAVEAGADVLVHSVEDKRLGEGFLGTLAERDVLYVTTLIVDEGYREVLGGDVRLSRIERRLGDPEAMASWQRLPEPRYLPSPAISEAEAENLRRVAAHGITIAAGSDAGNIGTLHGPALHRELELMVEAGLSPHEVLRAATLGGAAVMGRTDDLGSIEAGKLADLVILDANPLQDIRNTRAIHRVIKGGHVVQPRCCEAAKTSATP